ncbi:unnamed protein product [Vitrella brassicaformis CCMP3155]|uniref:Uncharacterized protein n=1 Tax=Vitrella brassicaformis (strain CCMP3155) TaxID=1169540 RepID=A0A0G4FUX8_VITBC|nr:unnamed protein product [Vitrella brassicaformis CCMP3155]|eukprot:CEM18761.1 unnamed protein product [Vitrella brassicaformis CCMP3155]
MRRIPLDRMEKHECSVIAAMLGGPEGWGIAVLPLEALRVQMWPTPHAFLRHRSTSPVLRSLDWCSRFRSLCLAQEGDLAEELSGQADWMEAFSASFCTEMGEKEFRDSIRGHEEELFERLESAEALQVVTKRRAHKTTLPMGLLALSNMFTAKDNLPGLMIGGIVIVVLIALAIVGFAVWYYRFGGRKWLTVEASEIRHKQNKFVKSLTAELQKTEHNEFEDDWKAKGVDALSPFATLPSEDAKSPLKVEVHEATDNGVEETTETASGRTHSERPNAGHVDV